MGWLHGCIWPDTQPPKTRERLLDEFLAGCVILKVSPLPSGPEDRPESRPHPTQHRHRPEGLKRHPHLP